MRNIRESLFWMFDFLSGSPIKKHYLEIKSEIESSSSSSMGDKKLFSILNYASNFSPFYKGKINKTDLSEFPIITKYELKENSELFLSTEYAGKDLIPMFTSGSTGTPLKVFQDKNKKQRNLADTLYFSEIAGYHLGYKMYYFRIWTTLNRLGLISRYMKNIEMVNVNNLSESTIAKLLSEMSHCKSKKSLIGYTSSFDAIAKFLITTDEKFIFDNVKSIIGISEALDKNTKQTMSKYFNCDTISRYSNQENGIIAQQEKGEDSEFLVNTASYYVEVLKFDKDEPCGVGEPGRVVITDLYNYAMPIIRYDTGDIAIISQKSNLSINRIYLKEISGRKMDLIYNTKGDLISSFVITNSMWRFTEINQYQFIQYGKKEYLMKLNCRKELKLENDIQSTLIEYLGNDADLKIEYVSEIPLLDSGKRKKVLNICS